jgi:hypothetical protein
VEQIFNFQTQIGRNFRCSEYHFRRQLSQLFAGLLNGSNRLAICELRQSKTPPVAETIFLADHIFLYKAWFWQNFAMTSLETLHMKNISNELSFPLATHMTHFDIRFARYGILNFCISSGKAIDKLNYRCSVRFLGRKMGESC